MGVMISVIFPVYNAGKYLKESMDCILNQTYENFELLALNDGSADNSLDILESCKDKRIKILSTTQNEGLVFQLNRGIEKACGKYIVRMDADDTCLPERFQTQLDFMEANPETGLCGSYVKVFGNENWNWRMPTDDGHIRFSLLLGATFAHNAVMIRKSILDQVSLRYRSEAFPVEDYDMWLRLIKHTRAANIPKFLTTYRIYGDQVTSNHNSKKNELLKLLSVRAFEDLFFKIDHLNMIQFEILRGERNIAKGELAGFIRFLNSIEGHGQKKIPHPALIKSLDRTLLMRIAATRSIKGLFHFILHPRFLPRIRMLIKVYLKIQ